MSHVAFWMEVLRGRQLLQVMHKLETLVHEGGRVQQEGLLFDLTSQGLVFPSGFPLCVHALKSTVPAHAGES